MKNIVQIIDENTRIVESCDVYSVESGDEIVFSGDLADCQKFVSTLVEPVEVVDGEIGNDLADEESSEIEVEQKLEAEKPKKRPYKRKNKDD